MIKKIEIENKVITIYYSENTKENKLPVIILNTFDEDGQEIWNKSIEMTNKEYILVTISNLNWNKEMSPWYMDRLYDKEDDYAGGANEYIELLTNKIVLQVTKTIEEELKKKVKEFVIAGYSLAGLFALYSIYKTNVFDKVISCSGSLWYPDFVKFIEENKTIKMPEKIYFSLGNKESKTKNIIMSRVEENTKHIEKFYMKQGIKTIYEENEGNHFQDVSNRIVKAICWILD